MFIGWWCCRDVGGSLKSGPVVGGLVVEVGIGKGLVCCFMSD